MHGSDDPTSIQQLVGPGGVIPNVISTNTSRGQIKHYNKLMLVFHHIHKYMKDRRIQRRSRSRSISRRRRGIHSPSMASAISSFKYSDSVTIVSISICTAFLCEAISWLLIYRTSSYKSLRSSIDKASKKLELMKTSNPTSSSSANPSSQNLPKKPKSKKMDRVETTLKESTRDLSLSKFKSGAVVAAVLFVVFGFLNSLFEGKAVAKLPFSPAGLVQKMSHRGLPGDDPTDCSMAFLYFLCSISIRTNLQKFLGFAPPRGAAGAGLFPLPDPKSS